MNECMFSAFNLLISEKRWKKMLAKQVCSWSIVWLEINVLISSICSDQYPIFGGPDLNTEFSRGRTRNRWRGEVDLPPGHWKELTSACQILCTQIGPPQFRTSNSSNLWTQNIWFIDQESIKNTKRKHFHDFFLTKGFYGSISALSIYHHMVVLWGYWVPEISFYPFHEQHVPYHAFQGDDASKWSCNRVCASNPGWLRGTLDLLPL